VARLRLRRARRRNVELERHFDDYNLTRHCVLKLAPKGCLESEMPRMAVASCNAWIYFRQLYHRQAEVVSNEPKEAPPVTEAHRRRDADVVSLDLLRCCRCTKDLMNSPTVDESFRLELQHRLLLKLLVDSVSGSKADTPEKVFGKRISAAESVHQCCLAYHQCKVTEFELFGVHAEDMLTDEGPCEGFRDILDRA
jgi:hypothetical protein